MVTFYVDTNNFELLFYRTLIYLYLHAKQAHHVFSELNVFSLQIFCFNLYYTLIYPFLTYGIIIWLNTYSSDTNPLFLPQKRVIRLITFSDCDEHTNPLFIKLKIIKFNDLVYLDNAIFVHNFHSGELPEQGRIQHFS